MSYIVPLFIALVVGYGLARNTSVYENFSLGAKDGVKTLFNIFPSLLAVMVTVSMLRTSGALELLLGFLSPLLEALGIEEDVMLLGLIRPLSGSGALGILGDTLKTHGADSFQGLVSSVIMGSTETTFYTLMVYFSKTKVKYVKKVIPAAIFGDIVGFMMSILVCRIFF